LSIVHVSFAPRGRGGRKRWDKESEMKGFTNYDGDVFFKEYSGFSDATVPCFECILVYSFIPHGSKILAKES
jgi:hypothetical protein